MTPHTPRGVQCTSEHTRFTVFAEAESVAVRLIHPGTRQCITCRLEPAPDEPGVWTGALDGNFAGWSYSYEIVRDGRTLADIVDPWARLIRAGRGYISADQTEITPRPECPPGRAIIYELHIRDFTRDPVGGVRGDWRGRYLGLTQTGTTLNGTKLRTGLDHILELGVTVVQLMPVHSFAMPYNPVYEWGYMPLNFNAPHDGYAASVELEAPVREFKRLVSTLHAHGLRVTLDVVYNHTAEKWPDKLNALMALAPRTYFRFKDDGTPWNGSACGNEFRSDSDEGRRFIVDSCRYWVNEFGIDGFRFDLMGLIDVPTMRQVARELHAVDPSILVYGEPWTGGPTPIEVNHKGRQRGNGWGVFNDEIRDGLRGRVFDLKDLGFLNNGEDIPAVKSGILGGVTSFADSPLESINYVECHDNHTLMDRLMLSTPKGMHHSQRNHMRMSRMAALVLMTSQGIPFIHSGQEFGRTKAGEDNTYNLGDQINNISWKDKDLQFRQFAFYRDVINMRTQHPMFRLTTKEDVLRAVKFLDDDLKLVVPDGCIGYQVTDVTGQDRWSAAVVLLNGSRAAAVFQIPEGKWRLRIDNSRFVDGEVEGSIRIEKSIRLKPHCGAVLYQVRPAD